jgi:adenylate cyclase class 1
LIAFDAALIRRNRKLFLHYNGLRRQLAYNLNPEKASVAFEIIPALLSVNEGDLPGHVSGGETPCGVYGIGHSSHLQNVIQDYFPETRKRTISYQHYVINKAMVESLFIVGSIGTVGQTEQSDFDYWVCVDRSVFSERAVRKLQEKTELIARWCRGTFGMDVHFFVLGLDQIQRNDFGKVERESSGSSQKKFLKEESYRTMVLVEGKIPLWWVVPSGATSDEYALFREQLKLQSPLDATDFVDLGFLDHVSHDEFLGNALWQLSKGIKDPFKALLKMAMMEVYLSETFRGPLLSEILKARVLGGCRSLRDMDPYLLMVDTILEFYGAEEGRSQGELMRKAFYVKSDPKITRMKLKTAMSDYKVEVFKALMEEWAWPVELVEDLNQVGNWSYGRQLQLSTEINKYFFSTYRRLSGNLRVVGRQAIDDNDLTILGRMVFVLFAKSKDKLSLTPFLTNKRLVLGRCIFQYEADRLTQDRWALYDASWYPTEKEESKRKIYSADSVVRNAAWLVNNGLYAFHRTAVEMNPNPTGVTMGDLEQLLKHLQSFFHPASDDLDEEVRLNSDPVILWVMAVLDMEAGSGQRDPMTIDVVSRNSWGEMFVESCAYDQGLDRLRGLVSEFRRRFPSDGGLRLRVHLPDGLRDHAMARELYQALSPHPPWRDFPAMRRSGWISAEEFPQLQSSHSGPQRGPLTPLS